MKTESKTLVVGGTGKTGRRVRAELDRMGVAHRSASASGTPSFLWDDEATWAPHLEGIESMYIAYYPDLTVPGAADHVRRLTEQAVAAGTRRIVLLSGRGEPQTHASEQAVAASGASFTVLRCAFFAQNFSEGFLADGVRAGELAFPAGSVGEPFVDLDDVAAIAALALTSDAHAGKTYDLTGPRVLDFGEAMASIGRATGRPTRYIPVSASEYEGALLAFLPPEQASALSELFAFILDGHNAHTSGDVAAILGRPARDFDDWARAAAAAGAWNAR